MIQTREGLPLGLTAIKFWSRQTNFKRTNAPKRPVPALALHVVFS